MENIIINLDISDSHKEDKIEINIKATEYSKEVKELIETINNLSNKINTIIGRQQNNITLIDINEIIKFYSNNKNVYCQTKNGIYEVKQKMYELEEKLDKNFIRISNSCICNLKHIKYFDLNKIGNIQLFLDNDTVESVSKRRVPIIMKFLKERGDKV